MEGKVGRKGEEEGGGEGRGVAGPPFRKFLDPPLIQAINSSFHSIFKVSEILPVLYAQSQLCK